MVGVYNKLRKQLVVPSTNRIFKQSHVLLSNNCSIYFFSPKNMSVCLETSLGDIIIDLHFQEAPMSCYNFLKLSKAGYYDSCCFFKIVQNMYVSTGDPQSNGSGGKSIFSLLNLPPFTLMDEITTLKHNNIGTVGYAHQGTSNSGGSQFYLTTEPNLHILDGSYTIFGQVIPSSLKILREICETVVDSTNRPLHNIRIHNVVIISDPFPDPTTDSQNSTLFSELITADSTQSDSNTSLLPKLSSLIPSPIEQLHIPGYGPFVKYIIGSDYSEIDPKTNPYISNNPQIDPRHLKQSGKTIIYISNLNKITQSNSLSTIFSQWGPLIGVRLKLDPYTRKSRCFAFIEYNYSKDAENFVKKYHRSGIIIDEHIIYIDFAKRQESILPKYLGSSKLHQKLSKR